MDSVLTANSSTPSSSKTQTVSSVYLTLPLACQICLGKVKDPVVCANHHVFCSACMTQWLKSSQSNICPTCRVPINDKQPCKRIIGSMDCSPTVPDKNMKEHMRKARFEILYQEYENEIKGLEQKVEEFQAENGQIKEINIDLKTRLESTELRLARALKSECKDTSNSDTVTQDINTILKLSSRLQDMINYNKTLKDENDTYKVELRDMKRENEALKEEMEKLLQSNNFNKSPQKFSRYTVAALQTKVDHYEREIARLRRALDRSDEYIDDLKRKLDGKKRDNDSNELPVRNFNDFSDRSELSFAGNEPSNSSHDKGPQRMPSTLEASRIDELANIALATRHLPFETPLGDNSPALQQRSPLDLAGSPHELPVMNSGFRTGDFDADVSNNSQSNNKRSIFEDPSKFPACAKLIELTKVRREAADQPLGVTDGSPSEINQNGDLRDPIAQNNALERRNLLNMLMQQCDGVSSPIAATMVGREGSAFSVVSNQIPRSTESLPSHSSPHRPSFAENLHRSEYLPTNSSPSAVGNTNISVVPPSSQDSQTDYSQEDQGLGHAYPSSVVLTNSQSNCRSFPSDNDEVFPKRIKVEQEH